ncbi:NDMA-dependent alcohol dehydrogenase [Sphaerobacter thermophilus]|uniref:NDMA-dependent alcohol dehydrogenase n=1 Tax=Sphaerobacter thermophilus TaxID=2057 RepID=UPI0039C402A4
MKTRAAVLYGLNEPFRVEEIELDDPKEGEVLVRLVATGLCHSDWHLVTGDIPMNFPVVGGHEGAGVVEKVGPGVTDVKPGDHVILTFIPSCGKCRWCTSGLTMLCDLGAHIAQGQQLDGTFRMHTKDGEGIGQMCLLGTFSEWTVCPAASVIPVSKDLPLDKLCLVACGVPTGFGAAINRADVQPGETVAIFGIGGVGINAVQGAAVKGASKVIAVDPVDFKLEMAEEMGATHTINNSKEDAVARIMELTNGVGADKAIVTVGVVTPEDVGTAFKATRKGGRTVVVGVAPADADHINVPPHELVLFQKEVLGCLFGTTNMRAELPKYIELYQSGMLKIDELITKTYTLDQINEAYQDMLEGRNIRGVIRYQ